MSKTKWEPCSKCPKNSKTPCECLERLLPGPLDGGKLGNENIINWAYINITDVDNTHFMASSGFDDGVRYLRKHSDLTKKQAEFFCDYAINRLTYENLGIKYKISTMRAARRVQSLIKFLQTNLKVPL